MSQIYYTLQVNVPLNDGIDDNSYEQMFKPVLREILGTYDPKVRSVAVCCYVLLMCCYVLLMCCSCVANVLLMCC
jgi:hypothetical protein